MVFPLLNTIMSVIRFPTTETCFPHSMAKCAKNINFNKDVHQDFPTYKRCRNWCSIAN